MMAAQILNSVKHMQTALQDWRAGEQGAALLALLRDLDGASPETIHAALGPVLQDPVWLFDLTRRSMQALAADPTYQPPLRVIRSDVMTGMIVADMGYIAIAPLIIDAAKLRQHQMCNDQTISFAGGHSISHIVRSGGARLTLYKQENAVHARISGTAQRPICNGEAILCDDTTHSLMLHPGDQDLSMIRVYIRSPKTAPVMEFSATTGQLIRRASNDDAGSRSQMMLTMLRSAGHPDAGAACALMLQSADADTRWHAMREFLGSDAQAAMPELHRLAQDDPDPAVRATAIQTLNLLSQKVADLCPA
jgi:hypothetical protein